MKDNSLYNSRPALVAAYLRSVESYRPEAERLFDDRFSRELIPPAWKISLLPGLRQAIVALIEANIPGYVGGLYCRTLYIDEALKNALAAGIKQAVILGAGFDARAYRIPGIQQVHVFELDLPNPQRLKQTFVKNILGELPAQVSYVPIDFDRQDIDGVMTEAGFQKGVKTFFICEGVTQYINEKRWIEYSDLFLVLWRAEARSCSRISVKILLTGRRANMKIRR